MPTDFAIHLLDVGDRQYGDAILCVGAGQTVLIDGAHAADDDLIHNQVLRILGRPGIDLLIVTHCHSDHIGCLPSLIQSRRLTCDWALVADPVLGFCPLASVSPETATVQQKVLSFSLEEPIPEASDGEILELIEDAVRLHQDYTNLISFLRNSLGNRCVVFRGPEIYESPGLDRLIEHFSPIGLSVLGPSKAQLEFCAGRLGNISLLAVDSVSVSDSVSDLIHLYRLMFPASTIADAGAGLSDAAAGGGLINNQSLVCALGSPGRRVLLTGDMQLADPGSAAPALKNQMLTLRQAIQSAGPYDFVKLPHHGSENGFDSSLIAEWTSHDYGISTGTRSRNHPGARVLKLLKNCGLNWVRTDRNGLSSASWLSGDRIGLSISRGSLCDAGPESEPYLSGTAPPSLSQMGPVVPLLQERTLPNLLFVTNREKLAAAVGATAAAAILRRLEGLAVCPADVAVVRKTLRQDPSIAGVVLIGGPDVVPPLSIDTLPPGWRAHVQREGLADWHDDYKVWSDDDYGTPLGSQLLAHPVTRIPDGGDAGLILRSLAATPPASIKTGSGIRNLNRPYAHDVFSKLPAGRLLTSEDTRYDQLPPYHLDGELLYLALHMYEEDGSRARGEYADHRHLVAATVDNIPDPCPAVVVSGCCWGALITGRSFKEDPDRDASPRRTSESIALTCLSRGANAFIGCTGAHHPPVAPPWWNLAGPMHHFLFDNLLSGEPPSRALWLAKLTYARGLTYSEHPAWQLREHKTSRMFTCLGLGW